MLSIVGLSRYEHVLEINGLDSSEHVSMLELQSHAQNDSPIMVDALDDKII